MKHIFSFLNNVLIKLNKLRALKHYIKSSSLSVVMLATIVQLIVYEIQQQMLQ